MKFEMSSDEFKVFCAGLSKAEESIPVENPIFKDMPVADFLEKMSDIFHLNNAGNKINAIKMLREFANIGLKEAKDTVEGVYVKKPNYSTQVVR